MPTLGDLQDWVFWGALLRAMSVGWLGYETEPLNPALQFFDLAWSLLVTVT